MTAEYTGTYMLPLKGLRPEASAQYLAENGVTRSLQEAPLGVSLGIVDAQRGCTGQPNSVA